MGRHIAGQTFLRSALKYGEKGQIWVLLEDKKHLNIFSEFCEMAGRHEPVNLITRGSLSRLSTPGCCFLPGPSVADWAKYRACFGHSLWSLCGITHTTASLGAIKSISDMLVAPVYPWDALVCTSQAVKNNVMRLLDSQSSYLSNRLGPIRSPIPQLPVIPLGVEADRFLISAESRISFRREFDIADDDVVVLYVGRLSFHAKAHPLAMYQAIKHASSQANCNVVLLECGWFANDATRNAFSRASSYVCPSIKVVRLDGRDQELMKKAWSMADIFCSLADNIQETYGITPVEAMASGLPVVVSDWNGYRDTVVNGLTGFCIPTTMPPPGAGIDLAANHVLGIDSYDLYLAKTSLTVAVDVRAASRAFESLFSSSDLRRRMGAEGLRRVQAFYDWKVVIPQYEELWVELRSRRLASSDKLSDVPSSPDRLDPYYSFASYPSQKLLPSTFLVSSCDAKDAFSDLNSLLSLELVPVDLVGVPESVLREMLGFFVDSGGAQVCQVLKCSHFYGFSHSLLFRSLSFLIKLGLLFEP